MSSLRGAKSLDHGMAKPGATASGEEEPVRQQLQARRRRLLIPARQRSGKLVDNLSISSVLRNLVLILEMRRAGFSCINGRRRLVLPQPVQTSQGMPPDKPVRPDNLVAAGQRTSPRMNPFIPARHKMRICHPGLRQKIATDPVDLNAPRHGIARSQHLRCRAKDVPSRPMPCDNQIWIRSSPVR